MKIPNKLKWSELSEEEYNNIQYEEKQQYAEIDWSKIQNGDKLILKELNQPVTVLSLPDKNDYITVQMGNFKTKIKTNKLAPYDSAYEKKENVYRPSSFE